MESSELEFRRLRAAINDELNRQSIFEYPSDTWLKQWVRRQNGATRLDEHIENVIIDVRRWAKRRGLRPAEKQRRDWSVSLAQSYQTVELVRQIGLAEKARQRLWGSLEPLFPNTRSGRDEAIAWLENAQKEDDNGLEGKKPGRVTFSFTLSADQPKDVSNAVEAVLEDVLETVEKYTAKDLGAIEKALSGQQHVFERWSRTGGFNGDTFMRLEMAGGDGWMESVSVCAGTRLAELVGSVEEIAKASVWWSHADALAYIMCGGVPQPGVRTNFRRSWREGKENVSITLTIVGPASEQDVLRAYRGVLNRNDLRLPKPLNSTQAAVLRLVDDTAGFTWKERYKRWLELRRKYPKMMLAPLVKGNLDSPRAFESGAAALHRTYKRALERATWEKRED